jgi:hypothetical protein
MPKRFLSWKEESKKNYGTMTEEGHNLTTTDAQAGAILRIADSLETLIQNKLHEIPEYKAAVSNRDMYKRWYRDERKANIKLDKTIAGLRGYITRLKREKK